MKVLWLASWYPNKYEPVNGDFIQRHAKAVSEFMPVDVIHVVQLGKDVEVKDEIVINKIGALKEFIHYFSYNKTGIDVLDKMLYNLKYQQYYKQVIEEYIKRNGKPDILHVHVPMKAGIIALKVSRRLKIPYIISEHSSLYLKVAKDNYYKRSFFFQRNTKKVFENAAIVTNVSATIGNVIKQMFRLKDVKTIHNVVDTNYFKYQPKNDNKIFRWLHVSNLVPLKNPEKIIEAFHQLSKHRNDWELVICGPVPEHITQIVSSLNLNAKIKFTGEVAYEKVAAEMQQSDAFVLFSKHENFPCVIAEALCCGLPVVSSDVGGVAEAVNALNGILIEKAKEPLLTKALNNLMNTIDNYKPINISADAISKYSHAVIAKQFITLYNQSK